MNIFKNPIVIALIVGVLTYIYIMWSNSGIKKSKDQNKKELKNYQNYKSTLMIAPLVAFFVTWILAYFYFSQDTVPVVNSLDNINASQLKLIKDNNIVNTSESTKSYHLIGRGLTIPNSLPDKLPDVFIETL